jgi:hypothetical protein
MKLKVCLECGSPSHVRRGLCRRCREREPGPAGLPGVETPGPEPKRTARPTSRCHAPGPGCTKAAVRAEPRPKAGRNFPAAPSGCRAGGAG